MSQNTSSPVDVRFGTRRTMSPLRKSALKLCVAVVLRLKTKRPQLPADVSVSVYDSPGARRGPNRFDVVMYRCATKLGSLSACQFSQARRKQMR